jgi:hypothetical protein
MIRADETLIEGAWVFDSGVMQRDVVEERIERLATEYLVHLADDPESGAWLRLYKDPSDGRLWELSYPRGEMQGGGPRRLRAITRAEAEYRFRWITK